MRRDEEINIKTVNLLTPVVISQFGTNKLHEINHVQNIFTIQDN